MNHLVLLGDSIFDNRAYVGGAPAVIDQVQQRVPPGWQATLLAVDGNTAAHITKQLQRMPADATHLVLSVGGNDALGCLSQLGAPAANVIGALVTLSAMLATFRQSYTALMAEMLALNKPLMVCTVYDAVPGLTDPLKAALGMFNDVIVREAIRHGVPVLDLRMICAEPGDYSAKSPIEPSSQGGAKLADRLVAAVLTHDFTQRGCRVFW
jgi:GDSL-like Lipase/Acylhydrolase family